MINDFSNVIRLDINVKFEAKPVEIRCFKDYKNEQKEDIEKSHKSFLCH